LAFRFIPALLIAGLLVAPDLSGAQGPRNAEAQSLHITIPVYDYTNDWRATVQAGVQHWDAALAPRGIRLTYSPQPSVTCEALQQPVSGISVCDSTLSGGDEVWADGQEQNIWVDESGAVLVQGLVRFYDAPPDNDFADKVVCHELGHTLQLSHLPAGSDSCMAQPPDRTSPSSWDAANALLSIPEAPTVVTPAPDDDRQDKEHDRKQQRKEKQREKRQERKHHREHRADRKSHVTRMGLLHAARGPLGNKSR
jgi:hypothetical protein